MTDTPERHPRHASERSSQAALALHLLLDVLPTSDTDAVRLELLLRDHGTPLLAYVLADQGGEVGLTSETIADQFEAAYRGSYPDVWEAIDDMRHQCGWDDALERTDIPDGLLDWNEAAIQDYFEQHYLAVHLDDYCHVFARIGGGGGYPQQ